MSEIQENIANTAKKIKKLVDDIHNKFMEYHNNGKFIEFRKYDKIEPGVEVFVRYNVGYNKDCPDQYKYIGQINFEEFKDSNGHYYNISTISENDFINCCMAVGYRKTRETKLQSYYEAMIEIHNEIMEKFNSGEFNKISERNNQIMQELRKLSLFELDKKLDSPNGGFIETLPPRSLLYKIWSLIPGHGENEEWTISNFGTATLKEWRKKFCDPKPYIPQFDHLHPKDRPGVCWPRAFVDKI